MIRATNISSSIGHVVRIAAERGIRATLAGSSYICLTLAVTACSDPIIPTCEAQGDCTVSSTQLRVTITTNGEDFDFSGYLVIVGRDTLLSAPQADLDFPSLLPGTYTVQLDDVASNCTVTGGALRQVTIVEGQTTRTSYSISCAALPPATVNVTGTWVGEATNLSTYPPGTVAPIIYVLRQTGDSVTADSLNLITPSDSFPAVGVGRVSDNTLTLFFTTDTEVGVFRLTNTLMIVGSDMEGISTEQFGRFVADLALTKQ